MRLFPVLILAPLLLASAASAQETPAADPCAYDLAAMMRLDVDAFDNDMQGGWRPLGRIRGCEDETAELIAQYRAQKFEQERRSLVHHEAQLRAAAGQTQAAIILIEELRTLTTAPERLAYHDAELGFLRHDRAALNAARERLLAVPPPEGFEAGVSRFRERYPGQTPPSWPLNIEIVDAFIACFGRPYLDAYPRCEAR